jgi:3-deoxy-manno-octulosonate cytidylyltransferase (CMP-KDO synthetase)
VRALGVIPARIGATRFPGKPLALLAGKPLVVHVAERATACPELARVVVATDDKSIAGAAWDAGFEAVMTSADHASGTDRVAEVARREEFRSYEVVVNVQGDEPLLDPRAIAAALDPVLHGPSTLATLAHVEEDGALLDSPHVVKVVCDQRGDALYFTRAPVKGASVESGCARAFLRHVGLYVSRRESVLVLAALPPAPPERAEGLEQLRALWHGFKIRVVITPWRSRGVDTPSDLAALERDGGAQG